MARKKVREYDGKRLLIAALARLSMWDLQSKFVQVSRDGLEANPETYFADLAKRNEWLLSTPLVVKPDMLFGQRGKNNLVLLKADWTAAEAFIRDRMGMTLEIKGVTGSLSTFIVEPFVPHDDEFYLCMQTVRDGEKISFGACGGVDIEDNWDRVKEIVVSPTQSIDEFNLESLLLGDVPATIRETVLNFIKACFLVYQDEDMTLLEMNPWTLDRSGLPTPLDIRVELDTYATFKNMKTWKEVEFPEPWGREKCSEELDVQRMDDKSGASLKLSVLNPHGHIWTMVAGGGASVIYADTVVDLGQGNELGNYAEYSGNPKEEETYHYARLLLGLATRHMDGKRRGLLIGGGVANFTDVAATFTGIIQAIKDFRGKIQESQMKIFVRRGGPNYKTGLRLMEELGADLDLPIQVFGPETSMTKIVELCIAYVTADGG